MHGDPVGSALDLPVVVRSAHCQVPLNTHTNYQENTDTDAQPDEKHAVTENC